MHRLIIFVIIFFIVQLELFTSAGIIVEVDNLFDNSSVDASNCNIPTNGKCNLRSSWLKCSNIIYDDCVIKLPSYSNIVVDSSMGNFLLNSNTNISIVGSNSTIEAIQPAGNNFILGRCVNSSLFISNVTIKGFRPPQGMDGGAMLLVGNITVSLLQVSFFLNSGRNGGAVFISENTALVEISQCLFDSNSASQYGGSLYINNVTACRISYSTFIRSMAAYNGGAVSFNEGNRNGQLVACRFSQCYSGESGGAVSINAFNRNIQMTQMHVTECIADYKGGAISIGNNNRNIQMTQTLIMDCDAGDGGAISVYFDNYDIQMTETSIANCNTTYSGGAIKIDFWNQDVKMVQTNITDCTAYEGGAIYIGFDNQGIQMTQTSIANCFAADSGGAIYFFYGNQDIQMMQTNITNCIAAIDFTGSGGAIYISENNQNIQLTEIKIAGCTAFDYGGAISIVNSNNNVQITNAYVTSCTASYGGAISIGNNNRNIQMTEVHIVGCTSAYDGGAIRINTLNFLSITNSSISFCSAVLYGGGLYVVYANEINVFGSTIMYCTSTSGGGISLAYENSNFKLISSVISDCRAVNGGGISFEQFNDNILLSGSNITHCFASLGGGLSLRYSNVLLALNCVFGYNVAASSGGAIFVESGHDHLTFVASTFRYNTADKYGGGVYFKSESNNILISDSLGYQHLSIIESAHPYNTCNGGYLPVHEFFFVQNAIEFILYFDKLTNINIGDEIVIFNGDYEVLLVLNQSSAFPGISSPIISFPGPVLIVDLRALDSNNKCTDFVKNTYGFRINIVPVFETLVESTDDLFESTDDLSEAGQSWSGIRVVSACNETVEVEFNVSLFANDKVCTTVFANGTLRYMNVQMEFTPDKYWGSNANEMFIYVSGFASKDNLQVGESYGYYMSLNRFSWPYSWQSGIPGFYSATIDLRDHSIGDIPDMYEICIGNGEYNYLDTVSGYQGRAQFFNLIRDCSSSVHQETNLSVFESNTAQWGGALFMQSNNKFPLIVGAEFMNNSAVNGGAVCIFNSIIGAYFQHVLFASNCAHKTGAVVLLFTSNSGIVFKDCSFMDNRAKEYGGVLSLATGNGNGILLSGNEVSLQLCAMANNIANQGGALYLQDNNAIFVYRSRFDYHTALNGGGSIFLDTENEFRMQSSTVRSSFSKNSGGGGLLSLSANKIYFKDITIEDCLALSGGAVIIQENSELSLEGENILHNNTASRFGGAFMVQSSPMWTITSDSLLKLVGNKARRGSAVAFLELRASDALLRNLLIANNSAGEGGTVFWMKDNIMTEEPLGIRDTSVIFENNVAPYGVMVGTQATFMIGNNDLNVSIYYSDISTIQYELLDFYGERLRTNGSTSVSISLNSSKCGSNPLAYLTWASDAYRNMVLAGGLAISSHMQAFCYPEGYMTLQFEAQLGILDGYRETKYYIRNFTTLYFRNCEAGEFVKENQCTTCPSGSYSLKYIGASTTCSSCSSKKGVSTCWANNIIVESGYWRRYENNVAVLKCPLGSSSCLGGYATGDKLCTDGYEGPLCSVCSSGFFSSENQCLICSGRNIFSFKIIIIILVICISIVLITGYYRNEAIKIIRAVKKAEEMIKLKLDEESICDLNVGEETNNHRKSKKSIKNDVQESLIIRWYIWLRLRYSQLTSKLKIVIATMQIVVSAPNTFNLQFPRSFVAFLGIFNVLNFSFDILPLSCMKDTNFIYTLVITTSLPFVGVILLLLVYLIHYSYSIISLKNKNPNLEPSFYLFEFKSIESALKIKYIYVFIFFTYLILPSTTTTIFQMFVCDSIDPDQEDDASSDLFLAADRSISCNSSEFKFGLIWASFMIVVYPIGIPGYYFYKLWRARKEIVLSEDLSEGNLLISEKTKMLAMLYESYKPQFWYFEIIETTRRLALTAVLSVVGTGTSVQIVLGMLISFGYICLYGQCKPYKEIENSNLASLGQYQIYFTFFGSLIIQNNLLGTAWNSAVGIFLVLLNMSIILVSFRNEIRDYMEAQEETSKLKMLHDLSNDDIKAVTDGLNPLHAITSSEIISDSNINAIGVEMRLLQQGSVASHDVVTTKNISTEKQLVQENNILRKQLQTYIDENSALEESYRALEEKCRYIEELNILLNVNQEAGRK